MQDTSIQDGGLVASIAAHATHRPHATALVWRDQEIGYGDLWASACQDRDRVESLGLAPGEPVRVRAAKDPAGIALVLGTLAAGRPFLLPSASLPDPVLATLSGDAGCTWTISPGGAEHTPAGPATRPPAGTGFMLTTSGSTGLPKIVPLRSGGVEAFIGWAARRFGIGPGTAVLSYAPLSFDLCLLDIWTTLSVGGTVVVVDADDALRGERVAERIARRQVRVVQAVPMLHTLLATTGAVLDAVTHVISTGDALPPGGVTALATTFPNARLHNLYGCTETNDSLVHEIDPLRDADGVVPLGSPLPGVHTALVTEGGTVLDGPSRGELWVRTPFQSDGYLGAARHSGRFGPAPHDPDGPAWFRTGDLVRRSAEGTLVLLGRDDFRVKVRGIGVDLGEVERTLLAHSGVAEAVVLAVPNPVGGRRLAALAGRAPGRELDSLLLRRHCTTLLPREAVPHDLLITETALPRNVNGKVDRAAVARAHFGANRKRCEVQHEHAIAQFVIDEFLPDMTASQLDAHTDLIADGVIDSLGLLKLLVWLENAFGINVDEVDPAPEHFRSVAAIDAFVTAATAGSVGVE